MVSVAVAVAVVAAAAAASESSKSFSRFSYFDLGSVGVELKPSSFLIMYVVYRKKLSLRQSTVDESGVSPNDDVGKVLGKEHSRRVRCLELGATPSTTFKQANLYVGDIRIPSSDVCSSFGCQEKYDQLLNTLEEYMIMKGKGQYRNNLFLFSSPPTMPNDAARGFISLMNARSFSSSNPNDNH